MLQFRRSMPSQSKISSFFSKSSSVNSTNSLKRNCSEEGAPTADAKTQQVKENVNVFDDVEPLNSEEDPIGVKKVKLDSGKENIGINDQTKTSLTPDDCKRIKEKRSSAKLKLFWSQSHGVVTNVGLSWLPILESEFRKDYFKELCQFVSNERKKATIFPPEDQVFSWTNACDIHDVKVVILGQDPYHGPRQAHGLCFSVLPGIRPPPSLINMYKELESSVDGFSKPSHGNLTGWAKQGVLLLNACLTVRSGQANSHAGKGWEKLTDAVIQWINTNSSGVVFMLWGSYAQKKGAFINQKRHHVLKAVHPSPLSAHRGFFGCNHFSLCNSLLKKAGNKPIDWNYLPEHLTELS